ncbi:glutaredoxin family protein [Teredinibacter purpureus]|uniref:glutaredoxin family protein n=1 Tax=Teredinibacter purpureus TaxID=2731756 RepID=UPI0005F7C005|nr:glutaredoxin family protein [Teredinibacter purpureus]
MKNLTLYSTVGCHLCDLAKEVIARCGRFNVTVVDIAEDSALLGAYGVRIPVVVDLSTRKELGWPFDEQAFSDWLKAL